MSRGEYSQLLSGWMRRQRAALGVSQADLAWAVGVAQATISSWELGMALPDVYTHKLIKNYFKQQWKLREDAAAALAAPAVEDSSEASA
jgi:predicted transcriptional regulator